MENSIGNQKTMGGVTQTEERSMGDCETTGGPGVTLGRIDQYELIRELGGGGFGVVYLARDTVSGIDVAVKGLPPVVKNNAEELEQIRRNFALVSKLHHPNIAAALVLHRAREVYYEHEQVRQSLRVLPGDTLMVMTYAPGVTLSKWRKQFPEGKVPVPEALEVCRQIAAALDFAHAEKVVHRDIKPANIMVETRGGSSKVLKFERSKVGETLNAQRSTPNAEVVVKVLDFGLAAEIRSSMNRVSQETGDTSGTRPYMAPEQWAGKKQDGKTDQYALAVLFYELVGGEVPFAGAFETGDPVVMMSAVEHRIPEALPALTAQQNAVLVRALSKDPAKRYELCSSFWEVLSGMQLSVSYSVKALGKNGADIVKAVQTYNKTVAWVSRLPVLRYLQTLREFLVALLAIVPPVARFVDRILGLLLAPADTWKWIRSEKKSVWELCRGYALALVAISLLPSVFHAIHASRYTAGYWTVGSKLSCILLRYVLTLAGLFLVAKIIDGLASKIDAKKEPAYAFRLVVFSLVPVFLATSIVGFGGFTGLSWLAWADAIALLYLGIRLLMDCQKAKAMGYMALTLLLLWGLNSSVGSIVMRSERELIKMGYTTNLPTVKPPSTGRRELPQSTVPTPPRYPHAAARGPQDSQTMFIPSGIYPGTSFPPMNLPPDIWLDPATRCTLLNLDFPPNSPTNTHVVFGLSSQAELSAFCERMKTNGWRISRMGNENNQQYGRMGPPLFSASFAKAQKRASLIQRPEHFDFELVVCGPEDDPVTQGDAAGLLTEKAQPPRSAQPVPGPEAPGVTGNAGITQGDVQKLIAAALQKAKEEEQRRAAEDAQRKADKDKQEAEAAAAAQRAQAELQSRASEAERQQALADARRREEEDRQKAEARRLAEAERAKKMEEGLVLAEQLAKQRQWTNLLAQANALLALDAQQAQAKQYKEWAELYLYSPIVMLSARVNGKEVAAQVTIAGQSHTTPVPVLLDRPHTRAGFSYAEGDKKYEAEEVLVVTPDWKGERQKVVTLSEVKKTPSVKPATVSAAPGAELPAHPVEGQEWVSPSTGMVFVWVKTLKIWVGKYEVTNAEYRRKMPMHSSKSLTGSDKREYTLNTERQPVVFIHFGEATAYAEWLSRADAGHLQQYRYRLPTMKEFTAYIQCGVFLRTYPWGETWPPPQQAGNYDDEKVLDSIFVENYSDGSVVTCAVEQSGKNAWGLYGVGGNVWECCSTDASRSEFGGWRGASWADASAGYMKCEFKSGAASMVRNEESGFRLVLSK